MTKKTPEQQSKERYPGRIYPATTTGSISLAANLAKREGFACCIREKVEPLEEQLEKKTAENMKLRALVQDLVDACHGATDLETQTAHQEKTLAIAKQAGFVPTNTQDNG